MASPIPMDPHSPAGTLERLLTGPFEQLVDQLGVAVYVCDARGSIRMFNRQAADLWGREPALGDHDERFCGSLHLHRLDGTALAHADTPMAEVLRTGEATDGEVVIGRPDGSRCTVRVNIAPLRDADGTLLGAVNVFQDVTARKRHEDDAARLAAIVDSADDAIVSKTLDGIITSWNRAAEAMFGYTAGEALGRSVTMLIPEDRLREEDDILQRLRAGSGIHHYETERVRKDGQRIQVSLSVSPVRNPDGRIIGGSKIARDITARKRTEAELQANRATLERQLRQLQQIHQLGDRVARAGSLEAIYAHALAGLIDAVGVDRASILLFDDDGMLRFKAWHDLSDDYRRAVEGHSPWSSDDRGWRPIVVADVLQEPTLSALRPVLEREGIGAVAFIPLVHHGQLLGKLVLYRNAAQTFTDEEVQVAQTIAGQVTFAIARQRAHLEREGLLLLTERARADAEASNRAKDEFLAMLAHELRNPLAVIGNSCWVLERVDSPSPEAVRIRSMIARQTTHLARLLDDLLDVARITSGRIEMSRGPIDLREVVTQAVEAQRHRLESKRQALDVALPEVPARVDGDAVRLQQVVGNLLDNAAKYSPVGATISLRLEVDDDVVLRVRDDGAGIPSDRLESIFELFQQASPTLARTEGGLGIGLTLVRRIVELHGGTVRAASDGLGRGAEFTVRLPRRAMPAAADPPAPPPASSLARRILVIEDHPDGREALTVALRLAGHEVLQAALGEEGIALALARRPDVALVDIGLPDVDGYEVCRRIRHELGHALRIFALSGYGQPQDRERSAHAGFDAHLVKPVPQERLRQLLAEPSAR